MRKKRTRGDKLLGPYTYENNPGKAPINYGYKAYTYIPTSERVGSGWPSCGRAFWLVRKTPYRGENLNAFAFTELWEMKRYAEEVQKKRGKWVASTDPVVHKRPTLNQLLTDTQWEDGKPRTPCHLVVRFGHDQCSVVLTDTENEMSIATTGNTFEDVLELLEDALAANKVAWRPWGNFKKRK